jgi:predicted acetyltransferase
VEYNTGMKNKSVSLMRTTPETEHIVRNLFLAYFYIMAEYDDGISLNEHGLPVWMSFGPPGPHSPEECIRYNWWLRDGWERYIICKGTQPAGFVFIAAPPSHLPFPVDYELADFFVAPKYHRQGIGRQAARQAFELHHGSWVVYELARNLRARTFWHRLLDEYTGGKYLDLDNGTQQRFTN